jgi:mRNA interferase RelE/StbE
VSKRYRLRLARPAEKDIRHLPKSDQLRVATAIHALADDPRPRGCQKIVARQGYRIRVGIYRITYDVDDDAREVTVYRVLHRKGVYRY